MSLEPEQRGFQTSMTKVSFVFEKELASKIFG